MQRLHEDDLVGHLLDHGGWKVLRLPAIAEEDEIHAIETLHGRSRIERKAGDPLHPKRESLETLQMIKRTIGEYNFAGQYQQSPTPFGGGMVKRDWFKSYSAAEMPARMNFVFQSWDTANKPTELSDYSVCTTWGVLNKHVFLISVLRQRLDYPALKRVREQADRFRPGTAATDKRGQSMRSGEQIGRFGAAVDKALATVSKTRRLAIVIEEHYA